MTFPISEPTDPAPDKAVVRAALRRQRRDYAASLDPATRAALEDALADALEPLFVTAGSVAAYAPMKEEISPLAATRRASCVDVAVAFPFFVDRDSRMTFRLGAPVDPGPWGILQPAPDSAIIAPQLILMPLVAVDRAGNRVGMGKGHYDRALPALHEAGARLIGCGWSFQCVADDFVPDPWDVPLDGFASPDGLRMFR